MRGIIPDAVLGFIGDRYRSGISHAEMHFDMHSGDEDALTGGLGQALAMRQSVRVEGTDYEVRMSYRKVPGRGMGAPEKRYGTDGIFLVRVTNLETSERFEKGVVFQAKKRWRAIDRKLEEQASRMVHLFGDGLVVDYRPEGYRVCRAIDAADGHGSSRSVELAGGFHPLADMLAGDFLECRVGTVGLSYDHVERVFKVDGSDLHVISTDVVAVRAGPVRG